MKLISIFNNKSLDIRICYSSRLVFLLSVLVAITLDRKELTGSKLTIANRFNHRMPI